MKRLLTIVFYLLALPLCAQSVTPNLDLTLPNPHDKNWGFTVNHNFLILDTTYPTAACGDATHALGWDITTHRSFCQALNNGSGGTLAFSAITLGTNTAPLLIGTGGSLGVTGSGTINSTSLLGGTWAVPGAIGLTTPSTGAFSLLSITGITGSVQCLHVNSSGLVSGTGADCGAGGGGGVSSVSGTATQITVVNGSTTPTISIPSTFTFPGTITNNLSIFGSTTSANLASIMSDETGTGLLVFHTAPTLVTPAIASFASATHNHTNAAGGGTLSLIGGAFPNQGSTVTVLHGNAAGNPAFGSVVNNDIANATIDLTSKVTNILPVINGGSGTTTPSLIAGAGITVTGSWPNQTINSTTTGTVTHSAGALTANAVMVGNGAADSKVLASLGTTTTVLHGNASGLPTFGAVAIADLAAAGTPSSTTFLRGDNTWATPAGGAGTVTTTGSPTSAQVAVLSGTTSITGDPTYTFNSTTKNVQQQGMISGATPMLDPRSTLFGSCKGDGTDTSAAATACWQAAEAYSQAHGGAIVCAGGTTWTLDSVQLNSYDNIQGNDDGFVHGCNVTPGATGVAFKSAAGLGIINEVKISGIHFIGGVNPIDIIQVNGFYSYHLTFSNYTGNAITIVQGERHIFEDITTQHTGANAFSTFAFADCTKTVFTTGCAAAFPTADVDRQTITSVHNLGNILGGFSSQWFIWNGNVQGATIAGNMTCFFSCATGIIHVANVLENGDWVGPVVDNVGTPGSPEPIGFDIHACFNTRIASYNPGFGANNMTTQLYIDQSYGCKIENSQFSSTVDNATTFAIKHGNTFNKQDLTLLNVTGGYFDMNTISSFKVKIIGGIVTPNNALGGQTLSDETNGGMWINLMADSNGALAATSTFGVHRASGSFGYLNDFTTDGSHFNVNLPLRPKQLVVANLPAAGGNAGSLMVVTDSTAIAAEGQVCAGGGTAVALALSTGFTWKCY